jgi:hypothetical protein
MEESMMEVLTIRQSCKELVLLSYPAEPTLRAEKQALSSWLFRGESR